MRRGALAGNVLVVGCRENAPCLAGVPRRLVIRAIREACGLSQQEAARVFGGGPKAFEKYESGEVAPSSAMTNLLVLAARRPELFCKEMAARLTPDDTAAVLREAVRRSSVERVYGQIYGV